VTLARQPASGMVREREAAALRAQAALRGGQAPQQPLQPAIEVLQQPAHPAFAGLGFSMPTNATPPARAKARRARVSSSRMRDTPLLSFRSLTSERCEPTHTLSARRLIVHIDGRGAG
jgi:hypothetical protein